MSKFIAEWRANAELLSSRGMYDPADEHDSCGVGLIAAIDGKPRREVVVAGIQALKSVWHRGAVDADGKTGDGAGIHVEIPQGFFKEHIARTGHVAGGGRLAVGMVFLPKTDLGAQEICRGIVETEILNFGYQIYGWRQVPVDASVIGEKANATRPEIEQIMIANNHTGDAAGNGDENAGETKFELDLYIIRRRIERRVLEAHINDFYICSLSCRSIIYKGMFLAEQIDEFYPDLGDDRFESSFAIYHQRYSTNTFPTWRLAQPFRMLAHNGEINTIRGNINWMKCHEPRMVSALFRDHGEDIKPVIQSGSSDSAALDATFEVLVRAGRPAPMVKTLLIPEAWSKDAAMPEAHRALYSYCNTVMEPWDGPAAIVVTDGRWVLAGMDRNGLRPLRYAISSHGLLVVGSETGMVPLPETEIIEKGRIGPGRMIAVDLAEGRLYHDREIKDMLAADQPYGEWVRNITELVHAPGSDAALPARYEGEALRRRQSAAGYSLEDLEIILQPMIEDAKEATGSMGDDTPLAVLSQGYRGLHHFFRQQFSQVTNPPIDSLRESRVMSLNTRLGNLTNVLDEDASQTDILLLSSPVLTTADFNDMRERMGALASVIYCGFAVDGDDNALRDAIARIRREAEDAVRGGSVHLILDDCDIGPDRAAIPMILAAGAVHAHLVRTGLRTYTSINLRSAECLDVHYFAVLIGVGATTVNAYLAQESIADRHRRGLLPGLSLEDSIARYKRAVDQGLLKIMSKIGISVVSSYRGGYNFEAIGLSRTLVADIFPGMPSRISGIGLAGIQRKVLEKRRADQGEAEGGDGAPLPVGGLYRYRTGGETHAFAPELIHLLQSAVASDSYRLYKKYSQGVAALPPVNLRDLLDFHPPGEAIAVDDL
ncbi:MAG: glutamate synthase large subunit, partial [Proteobacteria bacterium]|nr:glutamate synthase large subunit [Pseudomonadota bacterium]